jgi:predicted lactoylglutathione lyase
MFINHGFSDGTIEAIFICLNVNPFYKSYCFSTNTNLSHESQMTCCIAYEETSYMYYKLAAFKSTGEIKCLVFTCK